MNDNNEIRLPPPDPPGESRPTPPQPEQPGGVDAFFVGLAKIVLFLIVGAVVLGGLVFATCLLSMRR